MAGLGKSRGSKSTSGSKSVGERIKSAREKGLGSSKSTKKDTATSGTERNYGGAKPRRVGQGGTTTITESVDNLVGGAFTKNRRGPRRISREERAALIAKREEQKAKAVERRSSRASRPGVLDKVREAQEAYRKSGKAGVKPVGRRRPTREEEGDNTGRRTRPTDAGIKGRGPKRPGRGVTDTTPADRGRGPRPGGNQIDNRGPKRAPRGPGQTGGNVGPGGRGPSRTDGGTPTAGGRGPKAGIGRGGKSGVGRGPKAGGNQIGNRGGGAKPGRGQGPKRNIGQSGGNVGPGGTGPSRIGDFGTVYFM